eukprot:SAG31_NODE_8622_length_1418_cov_2.317665_1_plen_136_part_00
MRPASMSGVQFLFDQSDVEDYLSISLVSGWRWFIGRCRSDAFIASGSRSCRGWNRRRRRSRTATCRASIAIAVVLRPRGRLLCLCGAPVVGANSLSDSAYFLGRIRSLTRPYRMRARIFATSGIYNIFNCLFAIL